MVDRRPILHPLPNTNFDRIGSASSTTLSHTPVVRRTSSPSEMYCDPRREKSHDGAMEIPLPMAAKGYVLRNHCVFSLQATRPKNRSGSFTGWRSGWELLFNTLTAQPLDRLSFGKNEVNNACFSAAVTEPVRISKGQATIRQAKPASTSFKVARSLLAR